MTRRLMALMQKHLPGLSNTCRDRLMKEDRGFLLGKIHIIFRCIYMYEWIELVLSWDEYVKGGLNMKERCRRRRFCDWFRGMLNLGIIAVWGKWMVQRYLVSAHKQVGKKHSITGPPPIRQCEYRRNSTRKEKRKKKNQMRSLFQDRLSKMKN